MTGFARSEGRFAGPPAFAWVWETKSVNGKGLDVRLRLPQGFDALEAPVRQAASETFTRGSITVNLSITVDATATSLQVNETLLDQLIALAARKAANLPAGIAPARLDGLMALRGVLDSGEAAPPEVQTTRDATLLAGLKKALNDLAVSRRQEGARLMPVVTGHLDTIAALTAEAKNLSATQPAALKAKLMESLRDLSGGVPALTEDRIAQEAAMLALKADLREELDRLTAHVAQARELLAGAVPSGRRLDFLSQEFNREANTLCSKSSDVALTRVGLALKATIDQFREQIQNIE